MTSTPQRGIILYGPPAAGKDTVTAALAERDPRCALYRRLKVGPGRTAGYRVGTAQDITALEAANAVIYANQRYGATYLIDQPELDRLLNAGHVPVVHLGQPEAVDTLISATPAVNWLTVELWCPREVAKSRIENRGTGDTSARLHAWDQTLSLARPDLRIDTSIASATSSARQIAAASALDSWDIVVPVLNPVDELGGLDLAATRRYATHAAATWIDYVLVNGSTTRGDLLSTDDRATELDIWIDELGADRVLACSWEPADLAVAAARKVTPMAVLRDLATPAAVAQFLKTLPPGATIYSHPMYGSTFTADLAEKASRAGYLPAGGKLAKVRLDEVAEFRQATPQFGVWDGSARHVQESVAAGAAGVVATPLAAVLASPDAMPRKEFGAVQTVLTALQERLDRLPDRSARRRDLLHQLHQPLSG